MRLRISARKSDLARLQAYMVGESLKKAHSNLEIEYRFKESLGDINLTDPLWKIPEKGVFTEDFYSELIQGDTDLVVHSWKDLPTETKPDTFIAATLPRADQRDLILVKKTHLAKMAQSKTMRTYSSSPRREYNLGPFLKDHLPIKLDAVEFLSVRGNIPTRIRKLLEDPQIDALILAKAALDRLLSASQPEFKDVQKTLCDQLQLLDWMVLPLSTNPNAAAQGALAVEVLKSRTDLLEILKPVHDEQTFLSAQKERQILSEYGGGCHQKIGVAVFQRPYGELCFVKGLTTQGVTLNRNELHSQQKVQKFPMEQMHAIATKAKRQERRSVTLDPSVNALYVSRTEAWMEDLSKHYLTWTAGIKTWKSLAQKGVWVHGCSEGLGEDENPRVDILAPASGLTSSTIHWAKLTHQDGFQSPKGVEEGRSIVATYDLHLELDSAQLSDKKSLYWSSGSQFLALAERHSEIWGLHHACGPGHTYKIIRAFLEDKNSFHPDQLQVFLDQEDWRKKCQV